MTRFPRLTLATLLMGSLALPAFALDTTSPKDASAIATPSPASMPVATKHAPAVKATRTASKSSLPKSGVHKMAATSEVPAAVGKAPVTGTVTGAPSRDVKAKDMTAPMGKEATKDTAVKPQIPAPVTKTN